MKRLLTISDAVDSSAGDSAATRERAAATVTPSLPNILHDLDSELV